MANPESRLTQDINRRVRALGVYAWKVSDRFTTGVPDTWYSGNRSDIWVEYKWLAKPPRTRPIRATLSEKQKDWLRSRHQEGRNVAVVVGTPHGCVLYPGTDFDNPKDGSDATFLSKQEIAHWIHGETQQ